MVLPKTGSEGALGMVNACVGGAMLAGSAMAALLPAPRDRVRAICLALLFAAIGVCGVLICLGAGWALRRYRWSDPT